MCAQREWKALDRGGKGRDDSRPLGRSPTSSVRRGRRAVKIVEQHDGSILEIGGIDELDAYGAGWRVGCALGCWTPVIAAGIAFATDTYRASFAFFVVWLLLTRQGMKIGSGITSADEHCVRLRIDRGRGELTWWEARGRGAKKESVPLESIESIEVVPAQYSGARRVVSILLFTDNEKAEAHDAIMEFDFLDDERAVELATSIAQILGWGPPVILPFEKDEDEAEPDSPEEETAAAGDDTDEDPVLGPRIRLSRTAQESPAAPPELDRRPFVTIPDGVQDPPWEKIDGIAVREDGLRIDERSRIWIGVGLVLSYFAVRSFMRILELKSQAFTKHKFFDHDEAKRKFFDKDKDLRELNHIVFSCKNSLK